MCFININDRLRFYLHLKPKKKNTHRICDNLCIEVQRYKANFLTCKDIMDQLLASQFD